MPVNKQLIAALKRANREFRQRPVLKPAKAVTVTAAAGLFRVAARQLSAAVEKVSVARAPVRQAQVLKIADYRR